MKEITYDKDTLCKCGHKYLLHLTNFKLECDGCDDPSISMDKKCPGFDPKIGAKL